MESSRNTVNMNIDLDEDTYLEVCKIKEKTGYSISDIIETILCHAILPELKGERWLYYLKTGKADTQPDLLFVLSKIKDFPLHDLSLTEQSL